MSGFEGYVPCSVRGRVGVSAGKFLDGLVGNEPRKTGWVRAEAAGDSGPWRQQAILGHGRWNADALREIVREYALETLAEETAVLVIDETGFLKQGKASCGVARQYTGSSGKITNCQIACFASLCRTTATQNTGDEMSREQKANHDDKSVHTMRLFC
jgi:SRSO17 transposase